VLNVVIGQLQSAECKGIQIRRFIIATAVKGEVVPSEIVNEQKENIGS